MKKLTFYSMGLAVAFFSFGVKADQNDSGNNSSKDCCGGSNHEDFVHQIALVPTVNAPTNATGTAKLRTDFDDCKISTTISVNITGLDIGTYNVSVVDVTGTNAFLLGAVNVAAITGDGDNDDDDQGREKACFSSTNVVNFGRGTFNLPSGLDPTNVASLFVYDTNGVVDMTGNFIIVTNTTVLIYNKSVSVIPGTAGQAQGQGRLTLAYIKGRTLRSFTLNANGLPGKQKLQLYADGVSSTKTSTTGSGTVKVRSLPHTHLADLQAVEARDKNGGVVFSLKF